MKEESEMPFAFSPSENENEGEKNSHESCLSKNIKMVIFIIIGALLVMAIIATIIIIVFKGENKNKDSNYNKEESDIKTNGTNFIKAVYNITKISERSKIYNVYTNPPNYYNMSKLISSIKIDDKNIKVDPHNGTYQFDKGGIYTVKFYFKEDLHYIEGFFMYCTDMHPIKQYLLYKLLLIN